MPLACTGFDPHHRFLHRNTIIHPLYPQNSNNHNSSINSSSSRIISTINNTNKASSSANIHSISILL